MENLITAKTKPGDVHPGDRFINTTITAQSKVFYLPDKNNPHKMRPYLKAICDCGQMVEGDMYPYARWDRVHSTDDTKAPHTQRCKKCGQGAKRLYDLQEKWVHTKAHRGANLDRINDLSGMIIVDYKVICPAYTDEYGMVWYFCQCACGTYELVRSNMLLGTCNKDEAQHCACKNCLKSISSLEQIIKNKLKQTGFLYKQQYKMPGLYGDKLPLRFDFAIFGQQNSIRPIALIECQGKQHYEPIPYFGGIDRFKKQQNYDNKKREYCNFNNIMLIEIPYWKF